MEKNCGNCIFSVWKGILICECTGEQVSFMDFCDGWESDEEE